jgi:hypothetical protein
VCYQSSALVGFVLKYCKASSQCRYVGTAELKPLSQQHAVSVVGSFTLVWVAASCAFSHAHPVAAGAQIADAAAITSDAMYWHCLVQLITAVRCCAVCYLDGHILCAGCALHSLPTMLCCAVPLQTTIRLNWQT